MIDVHVLEMDYTPAEVKARCNASLEAAVESAASAGIEVHVHRLPGVYGNLGLARKNGYGLGTQPYVTHVDDDDEVHADAFVEVAAAINGGATCVTTGETVILMSGGRSVEKDQPYSRHHLAVYQRSEVELVHYHKLKMFPDQFLLKALGHGSHHITKCLYRHYVNGESGSRRVRGENRAEAQREMDLIARPDLVVVEGLDSASLAVANDLLMAEFGQ